MPKLPRLKSKQLIKALKRASFRVDRISGSHYILYKDDFHPKASPLLNAVFQRNI